VISVLALMLAAASRATNRVEIFFIIQIDVSNIWLLLDDVGFILSCCKVKHNFYISVILSLHNVILSSIFEISISCLTYYSKVHGNQATLLCLLERAMLKKRLHTKKRT
jgi:hypothetical protein